jgi:hypothetical protein
MSEYGRDRDGNLYRRVGGDFEGCGCLIGAILVLGVVGVVLTLIGRVAAHSIFGPAWVGLHVYSYFNNNNSPGAYETKPDYFYACAGALFVLAVVTALVMLVALLGRSARAAKIGGALFALTVVVFIATVITHQLYFPPPGVNTQGYHSSGYLTWLTMARK